MQNQEKPLVHGLRQLLIHDLYAALPELNPDCKMQNDEPAESQPLSSEDEKELKRKERGIGAIFTSVLPGLITLAVESLTSWIMGKQQRRINKAVDTVRMTESEVKNTLSQYQGDFLMFTEVKHAGDALDYSVEMQLYLELAKEGHVTKYKEVDKAGRELLAAIAILSQRRLPRSLFPD